MLREVAVQQLFIATAGQAGAVPVDVPRQH